MTVAEAQAATNGGAESGGGLELHPLAQFELKTYIPIHIGDLNLSFTNSSLWMFIAVAIIFALMTLPTRGRSYVPGRVQAVAEMLYDATANMLHQATGRDGRPYFPLVFTLFTFLLVGNLQGMIPGAFTFTSHIVVTFALAIAVFVGTTAIGFVRHGAGFFKFFMPEGAPLWTAPLLVLIELISYISRPVSLSLRLFANMLVGHTMLKVLGGFVFALGVAGVIPLAAQVAVTALEFLIAVLQAYVFAILSCIYLGDALHLH
jgi:F-type H+-transporting ATPase subunit a